MKKLSFLLLLSATLFSCKVTWVPTKSASMIANVIDIQNSAQSLFDGIVLGDKGYVGHVAEYAAIQVKIDSLVSINQERDHASNILRQCVILQNKFRAYAKEHESAGDITAGEAKVYKAYIKSLIKPILVSELSLKN